MGLSLLEIAIDIPGFAEEELFSHFPVVFTWNGIPYWVPHFDMSSSLPISSCPYKDAFLNTIKAPQTQAQSSYMIKTPFADAIENKHH